MQPRVWLCTGRCKALNILLLRSFCGCSFARWRSACVSSFLLDEFALTKMNAYICPHCKTLSMAVCPQSDNPVTAYPCNHRPPSLHKPLVNLTFLKAAAINLSSATLLSKIAAHGYNGSNSSFHQRTRLSIQPSYWTRSIDEAIISQGQNHLYEWEICDCAFFYSK